MDGQEKLSNMQEGVPKGRALTYTMYENQSPDHRMDLQTPATTEHQQKHQTNQNTAGNHQGQIQDGNQQVQNNKEDDKQNKGSMAKDMGNNASTSRQDQTPKSKNKPSKKKRAANRKKQSELLEHMHNDNNQDITQNEGAVPCQKFIMVDDHHGMDVLPLNVQYHTPPQDKPPDQTLQEKSVRAQIIDEYEVENSEDEVDIDNQAIDDQDEDDEASELLIKAFSPNNDSVLEKELHQVTSKQGLSPRGIRLARLPLKKPTHDIKATAGRPNTRLFTSRSSQ
ncbi:hypothetical protein KY289_029044 [Solanum tuberosum]|nr:hypothetical protein KY289_029044 [Solanum tuberosum]